MMHQRSLLLYSENDKVKFLEIPYIDRMYSMYVILPKKSAPSGLWRRLSRPE